MQPGRRGVAIERVAQDGMPQGLQMHPQLMGATGHWLQGQSTAARMLLQQLPSRPAGFARRIDAVERRPMLPLRNGVCDPALPLGGDTGHVGNVALLYLSIGKSNA